MSNNASDNEQSVDMEVEDPQQQDDNLIECEKIERSYRPQFDAHDFSKHRYGRIQAAEGTVVIDLDSVLKQCGTLKDMFDNFGGFDNTAFIVSDNDCPCDAHECGPDCAAQWPNAKRKAVMPMADIELYFGAHETRRGRITTENWKKIEAFCQYHYVVPLTKEKTHADGTPLYDADYISEWDKAWVGPCDTKEQKCKLYELSNSVDYLDMYKDAIVKVIAARSVDVIESASMLTEEEKALPEEELNALKETRNFVLYRADVLREFLDIANDIPDEEKLKLLTEHAYMMTDDDIKVIKDIDTRVKEDPTCLADIIDKYEPRTGVRVAKTD